MKVDTIVISEQFRYSKQYIEMMKVVLRNRKNRNNIKVLYLENGKTLRFENVTNLEKEYMDQQIGI